MTKVFVAKNHSDDKYLVAKSSSSSEFEIVDKSDQDALVPAAKDSRIPSGTTFNKVDLGEFFFTTEKQKLMVYSFDYNCNVFENPIIHIKNLKSPQLRIRTSPDSDLISAVYFTADPNKHVEVPELSSKDSFKQRIDKLAKYTSAFSDSDSVPSNFFQYTGRDGKLKNATADLIDIMRDEKIDFHDLDFQNSLRDIYHLADLIRKANPNNQQDKEALKKVLEKAFEQNSTLKAIASSFDTDDKKIDCILALNHLFTPWAATEKFSPYDVNDTSPKLLPLDTAYDSSFKVKNFPVVNNVNSWTKYLERVLSEIDIKNPKLKAEAQTIAAELLYKITRLHELDASDMKKIDRLYALGGIEDPSLKEHVQELNQALLKEDTSVNSSLVNSNQLQITRAIKIRDLIKNIDLKPEQLLELLRLKPQGYSQFIGGLEIQASLSEQEQKDLLEALRHKARIKYTKQDGEVLASGYKTDNFTIPETKEGNFQYSKYLDILKDPRNKDLAKKLLVEAEGHKVNNDIYFIDGVFSGLGNNLVQGDLTRLFTEESIRNFRYQHEENTYPLDYWMKKDMNVFTEGLRQYLEINKEKLASKYPNLYTLYNPYTPSTDSLLAVMEGFSYNSSLSTDPTDSSFAKLRSLIQITGIKLEDITTLQNSVKAASKTNRDGKNIALNNEEKAAKFQLEMINLLRSGNSSGVQKGKSSVSTVLFEGGPKAQDLVNRLGIQSAAETFPLSHDAMDYQLRAFANNLSSVLWLATKKEEAKK